MGFKGSPFELATMALAAGARMSRSGYRRSARGCRPTDGTALGGPRPASPPRIRVEAERLEV